MNRITQKAIVTAAVTYYQADREADRLSVLVETEDLPLPVFEAAYDNAVTARQALFDLLEQYLEQTETTHE